MRLKNRVKKLEEGRPADPRDWWVRLFEGIAEGWEQEGTARSLASASQMRAALKRGDDDEVRRLGDRIFEGGKLPTLAEEWVDGKWVPPEERTEAQAAAVSRALEAMQNPRAVEK